MNLSNINPHRTHTYSRCLSQDPAIVCRLEFSEYSENWENK